ncbi:MAG: hypothetical protein GWP19_00300 [Planctomycetia bacterium]|nr:hypothetical protein [Planctomycetia bacterium]
MNKKTKAFLKQNSNNKYKSSSGNVASVGNEVLIIPNHSGDNSAGRVLTTPTTDYEIANKKYVDTQFPVTHASTTGQTTDDHHNESHTLSSHSTKDHSELTSVTSDQHHAQSHTIVSHSDTTATGAELDTLTNTSVADSLHKHLINTDKQYLGGTDFTITGAISGISPPTATNIRSVAIPYQTSDGAWRMKFNFCFSLSGTSSGILIITLTGIISKNIANYHQSFTAGSSSNTIDSNWAKFNTIPPNTNTFKIQPDDDPLGDYWTISGDIELDSKPTWAD